MNMEIIEYQSSPPPPKRIPRWLLVREKVGDAAFFCFVCDGVAAVSALISCGIDLVIPHATFDTWDLISGGFFYLGTGAIGLLGIFVAVVGIFSRKVMWALFAILMGAAIIVLGWKGLGLWAPHGLGGPG
jgi:hypothetical protein